MQSKNDPTYQNFGDAGKAVLRGKLIALNNYIRKEERSKTNDLSFHLRIIKKKKEEEEEQTKSKVSRRKDIIKVITEIHEIETNHREN